MYKSTFGSAVVAAGLAVLGTCLLDCSISVAAPPDTIESPDAPEPLIVPIPPPHPEPFWAPEVPHAPGDPSRLDVPPRADAADPADPAVGADVDPAQQVEHDEPQQTPEHGSETLDDSPEPLTVSALSPTAPTRASQILPATGRDDAAALMVGLVISVVGGLLCGIGRIGRRWAR